MTEERRREVEAARQSRATREFVEVARTFPRETSFEERLGVYRMVCAVVHAGGSWLGFAVLS